MSPRAASAPPVQPEISPRWPWVPGTQPELGDPLLFGEVQQPQPDPVEAPVRGKRPAAWGGALLPAGAGGPPPDDSQRARTSSVSRAAADAGRCGGVPLPPGRVDPVRLAGG